jgi:hypothetical protein
MTATLSSFLIAGILMSVGCDAVVDVAASDVDEIDARKFVCGDSLCHPRESCETCPADCGTCPDPDPCMPMTCGEQGATCGALADGCGGVLTCGTCVAPQTCGGGGTANVCGGSTNPSGQAMPVGDIPGWRQIFTDDFNVNVPLGSFPSAVAAKWSAYPYPWSTLGGYYYPEKVISQHEGVMDFWLHNEGGQWLMAAPMPRINGPAPASQNQLYGRYAIRFKADALSGYYAAWLLWPQSGVWPRDGEIDFPEGGLTGYIHGFMHRQGGTSGGDQDAYSTTVPFTGWHTAVIEWGPTACRFILDGVVIGTSTSRIPNTPMHWVIQTTTSPSGLPPAGTQGHLVIDWVTVYAPN